MKGAEVIVRGRTEKSGLDYVATFYTRDDGRFLASPVLTGTCGLEILHENYATGSLAGLVIDGPGPDETARKPIELSLAEGHILKGMVLDSDGDSIARCRVRPVFLTGFFSGNLGSRSWDIDGKRWPVQARQPARRFGDATSGS